MDHPDLLIACEAAITSLHQFFVDWFQGACPDSDDVWSHFERELAPDFVLVSPDGQVHARASLVSALRGHHAQHRSRRFRIEVRNIALHHVTATGVVAGYEEWQWIGERQTARQSTAVFARAPRGSTNLQWVHVHETWLPDVS